MARSLFLVVQVLFVALGMAACGPVGPISSGPYPEMDIGGMASTIDRSQILVPAAPNQEGGVFWPFVNLWSGNLVVVVPLLDVEAIGPDWDLSLTYNSLLAAETTSLGAGWRHSYEIALLVGVPDPQSITVRWGDGRQDVFVLSGSEWVGAPALHGMRITAITDGYRLRTKHGFVYEFNILGQLVAERDRNANTMTFSYDQDQHLALVTDASGRTCAMGYAGGRLVSVSLAGSLPITIQYAGADLARVLDVEGHLTRFDYDQGSRLVAATDPDGARVSVDYHPTLPVALRVTTSDGAERRFSYDPAMLETTVTDVVGQGQESAIAYRLDVGGRCIAVTSATLGMTHNTYDGANNLLVHTDADGHASSATYSPEGDLTAATDATGATLSITYEPTYHLWVAVTDQAGSVWTGQRDGQGNLTVLIDPLGNQEAWTYNPQGLPTSYRDQRGNTTSYGYDQNGYVSSMTDPLGGTTTATYNARGRPLSISDEEGFTTLLTWNNRDEPVSVTLPGGEVYGLTWRPDRMLAAAMGPRGETVVFAYNGRKQVVSQTDPLGFVSARLYDRAGHVTQIADAMGIALTIDRDPAGRVIALRQPDGGLVSFARTCCDIVSRTDERGTLTYQYSPRHELTAVNGPNLLLQYAHDARGFLTAATRQDLPNAPIGLEITRDAAGREVAVTRTDLGRTTAFGLDPAGNVILVTSPLSAPASYTYDPLNRPQSITAGAPVLSATMGYTPRGQLATVSYSNGVHGSRDYDPNGRLTGIHYLGPGWNGDYTVAHDPSGNRTLTGAMLPPPLGPMDLHVDWDLRNMPVRTEVLPGPGPTLLTYDPVGDRIHLDGPSGPVAYAYTAGHRMTTAGPRTLQWDVPGGCVQTNAPGSTALLSYAADGALKQIVQNGQTFKFQVDALGRLARVVLPSGAQRLIATDDADGRLARVEYFDAPGGQPFDSYVSAPGASSTGRPGWGILAPDSYRAEARDQVYFQFRLPGSPSTAWATLPDPAGSVTLRADGQGNLSQARVYGAFGERLAQTTPQHVATGFLGMEAIVGLNDLLLTGFAAGTAGRKHDPFALGLASLRPYLPETGSFLYDASFGPDGLYRVRFVQDKVGVAEYPWDFVGPLPEGARRKPPPWDFLLADDYLPPPVPDWSIPIFPSRTPCFVPSATVDKPPLRPDGPGPLKCLYIEQEHRFEGIRLPSPGLYPLEFYSHR